MASPLYGLAGKLLVELCSPVFQEYVGKPWGFGSNDEFDKLKNTLSAISAVLLDAEEKQITNHQVRDWLMKIKPVVYDFEDLLQEISYESLKRQVMTKNKRVKEVRIFFSSSNQVKYRLKMGRKVKLIRENLDAIALDSNRFNLVQRHEEMHLVSGNRREETHSFVSNEKVIGRDKDIQSVTKLLLESDGENNVSVNSIVGIGGLGKTTLAQSVYNTEKVKKHFELMMWVCVSEFFDIKLICEKIIESATKQRCERFQMDVVMDKLKRIIDGRKYLLVLDDVWNENPVEWMKLEELLTGGEKGSKVLITTRTKLVARAAKSIDLHILKGLSQDDSWALFKQAAFKQGVEPESSIIVGIGKEVVEICAGVPLAIKAIASVLGLKEKEIDWLDFKKNDLPSITQDSEGKIVPILKVSYDYLTAPAKRCFAYRAIFPKDWRFDKESLIRMWMAQGLIQLDGTPRSLEDVGEKHFIDLVDRSFFEVFDKYEDGGTDLYKMHNLVHDLAQSIGGKDYYNPDSGVHYVDRTTRHAWTSRQLTTKLWHAKKLRTLVIVLSFDMGRRMINKIMTMFKQVRVLVILSMELTSIPHFTDGLRHLSYLDLSYNNFEWLPESISSLYNLQTLLLHYCKNLKKLPRRTRDLVSLRHLEIYGCDKLSHMPRGMEDLTCLQTLTDFVMGPDNKNCGKLGELKCLVNLRGDLRIRNLRGSQVVKSKRCQSNYPSPLTQLKFLQVLMLHWNNENLVNEEEEAEELLLFESLKPHSNLEKLYIEGYGGKRFPSWMDTNRIFVCLPNIVHICIGNCKSFRHVSQFGSLPSLETLGLWHMVDMEYLYEEEEEEESPSASRSGGECPSAPKAPDQLFPSLKTLHFRGMPKLRRMMGPTATSRLNNKNNQYFPFLEELGIENCPLFEADGSVTPELQTLIFSDCDNIVTLPEWSCNLTSLQEISLRDCNSLASIPDCMLRLTSLQLLEVQGASPELVRRCEMEIGEDWHNIAHIPNISLEK